MHLTASQLGGEWDLPGTEGALRHSPDIWTWKRVLLSELGLGRQFLGRMSEV